MLKIAMKLGIPVVLVLTLLWVIRKFMGLDAFKIAALIVVILIALVLVLWLLVWISRKIISAASAARARREMDRAAAPVSSVNPQDQQILDGLQRSLHSALKVIRESKLARGRKSEGIYAMPWILMLGPAGSGKTSSLQESGVEFSYVAGEGRKNRRGGGEGGCNYWFSRHAVVLDLSGRIAAEEQEIDIFKGFLSQIKRARKDRPIDGVVVTVSIREIMDQSAEESELLAGRIRQRMDEMIRRLEIRFPVYILFTKCDQIEGFPEFFESFRTRERAQVWGATISAEQRRQQPADQIFKAEFARLASTLSTYRLRVMASEKNPAVLPIMYGFPARFASLRKKLEEFTAALLQPTPYSERPVFRGFYFISSAGIEAGPERAEQPESGWDPNRRLAPPPERLRKAKSYFLETLFPGVIFADHTLAKPSVDIRLRRRLWLDVAFFSLLTVCIVLLAGMIYSFIRNRALVESTRKAALLLTNTGWDANRTSSLTAMQRLRVSVEELDRYEKEGPPLGLRWGLYTGDDIAGFSRRLYFRRLQESFIDPVAEAIRRKLNAFSGAGQNATTYSEFYTLLRAYLMMSDPARVEVPFLEQTLAPIWKTLAPSDGQAVALEQLGFYARQLKSDPNLKIARDERTVAAARRSLGRYPIIERIFTGLKEEGNQKLPSFKLSSAGGKGLEYLNANYEVPGVFTEQGWSKYFKDAAATASKKEVQDDWVLGAFSNVVSSGKLTDADYERLLREKYFAQYNQEWQKFLDGISIRPLSDLREAKAALESLSGQDSALLQLLTNVAINTMLKKEPEKSQGLGETFSNAMVKLGLSKKVDQTQLIEQVANEFRPLHEIVTSQDEGKTPPMSAQYVTRLEKVQLRLEELFGAGIDWDKVKAYVYSIANNLSSDEFQDGYRMVALIQKQCSTRNTQMIAPLLKQPLQQTWAALLNEIGNRLDGLWKTKISEIFKRDLEGGYPFNPNGQDISLLTLSKFLKPNDGILSDFYQNELKMFLSPSGNGYVPRQSVKLEFSPAFLDFLEKMNILRQALYPGGNPEIGLAFELTPNSTPGVSQSLLDVDGQLLRYRNEPLSASLMTWPSKSASRAKLSAVLGASGEHTPMLEREGEWAFFRLLGEARVVPQSQTVFTVTWLLHGSSGNNVDVRYRLLSKNVPSPFAPDFFKNIVCPEHVCRIAADESN